MKLAKNNCAYCKKTINGEYYAELVSGLHVHDDCYRIAFTDKSWKGKKFRIKNNVLFKVDKITFVIGAIFNIGRKK